MKTSLFIIAFIIFFMGKPFCQVDSVAFDFLPKTLKIDDEIVSAGLANEHINAGRFLVLTGGLPASSKKCDEIAQNQLGFEIKPIHGCVSRQSWKQQIEEYNAVVLPVLNRRFFGDIWQVYENERAKCHEEKKFFLFDNY